MYKEQILEKYKSLHKGVSVSLPSVDDAGIIAVSISEIGSVIGRGEKNSMSSKEQAFFCAGFIECIKYLEIQSDVK